MPENAYDCIVIGSGPGGYVAAIRAAQLGMKTAVVERDKVGGRCLNYACIPAKAVLRVADILPEIEEAGEFGIDVNGSTVDFGKVIERRAEGHQDADRRRRGPVQEEQDRLIEGSGSLAGGGKVKVGDDASIEASKAIVLATGSVPEADPRHGVRRARDRHRGGVGARGAARDDGRARRRRVGRGDRVRLRRASGPRCTCSRCSTACCRPRTPTSPRSPRAQLGKQNIAVHTGTKVENVKTSDDKVSLTFGDEQAEVDWLVIAAGRGPDVEGLGLDEAGVKLGDHGLIEVDGALRTSAERVYAIGDLVPGPALAHKASDEGVIAVEDAAGLETHPIEYIDIPRATFCTPNVASFGLTEEQAREQGLDVTDRQGPVRRGRRRHRLRRPHRPDQDRRRQAVRRAGRRPHRRREGDRADPGARQRASCSRAAIRRSRASSTAIRRCRRA